MNDSETNIQKALQEIAELEVRIKADIAKYNLLSSQADTDQRLALLSASSNREEDDDEDNKKLTNDEYVKEVQCAYESPYVSINTFGSYYWFPSSVGC